MHLSGMSPEEWEVFRSRTLVPALHRSQQIVIAFLDRFQQRLVQWMREQNHPLVGKGPFRHSGKISRGWNYRGYPYVVLDFPVKVESSQDFWMFRILCWWGHAWNVSLIVSGTAIQEFRGVLERLYRTYPWLMWIVGREHLWENLWTEWVRGVQISQYTFQLWLENAGALRVGVFLPLFPPGKCLEFHLWEECMRILGSAREMPVDH